MIFSAPSGSGKTTIITHLRTLFPQLAFSVSACSRVPRVGEIPGESYHFLSSEEFRSRIEAGDFLEWEEVYEGMFYGTLRSEVERIWANGGVVLFDVDVKGALNLKAAFGEVALTVFVRPPSLEELRLRLERRGTESAETIDKRIARATLELGYAERFDRVVVNDNLEAALRDAESILREFLAN